MSNDITDKVNILLVDDDPMTLHLLQTKLAGPGRTILTSGSGARGLAMLAEESVSLVLLDLMLPDMDGRKWVERLRDNAATAAIPVIILSGLGDSATRIQCFNLGVESYFAKPVDLEVLAAAVTSKLRQTAESSRRARVDLLTGLPNRAAFVEAFARARAFAERGGEPLSVSILDLDRFKSVNDLYGHDTGDAVLRGGSAAISGAIRRSDLLARWGGEEFVALFPKTNAADAKAALEKALKALRGTPFRSSKGQEFSVTFSAGVVEVAAGMAADAAVAEADRFLYIAKAAGRNRILCPTDSAQVPKKRIVFAEDDPLISAVVKQRLSHDGFDVLHFPDGAAALAAVTTDVSLCITDIQMPEMDGFELIERIRKSSASAKIPILVLTTLGNEKDVVRGLDLGANDYMVKPFSPIELLARVRRLLNHP